MHVTQDVEESFARPTWRERVANPYRYFFKTLIDWVVAFCLLVVTSPLNLVIAYLIWVDTSGPILFWQERESKYHRIFFILKFRTMKHAKSRPGYEEATKPNPEEITLVGGFLRRSHLDEIPQLVNVLLLQISIVGPRPRVKAIAAVVAQRFPEQYAKRCTIKAGITGPAQLSYGAGHDESSLIPDCWYVDHVCFVLDLKIKLYTILGWKFPETIED